MGRRPQFRRWARLIRRAPRDEIDEELGFHIEQRVKDYVARGMEPEAARRAALERLGDLERVRRECAGLLGAEQRTRVRREWLRVSWLDVKLGLRMLVKYPGLTLVGGLGMAVAIAVGAGFWAFGDAYVFASLPLDEGDRIIGIEVRDLEANDRESRILHDFVMWGEELRSVEDLAAFRTVARNLIGAEGGAEPVFVAEMTASGFRVARVAPLLGRALVEEDEREGAPRVVVIGHDAWERRFAADPEVVGRTIRLGAATYTVVGVMPEGFTFPLNHQFWTPLRADPADYERREGPGIFVFGRLAPGVSREQAQAELTAIGQRTATAFPQTHEHLRPRIVPFTAAFGSIQCNECRGELYLIHLWVSSLLIVIAVNVAILVYARTATRAGDIAVRSALGASRGRIVGQLFVEALVLAAAAALVGLVLARVALAQLHALIVGWAGEVGGLPFWIEPGLSAGTVLYVAGLAVLGAAIVGVVPALKVTGRALQPGLRSADGRTGLRLGRTWTALIVVQVAVAVAVLPGSIHSALEWLRYGFADPGFAADEYLTAGLEMEHEAPPGTDAGAYEREFRSRYAERLAELERRLAAEPGVAAVTLASSLPGDERSARIEVDGVPAQPAGSAGGHTVRVNRVDADYFDAFDIPLLAGRRLHAGDMRTGSTAVVVSRAFVRQVLGGGGAVGRRIRYREAGQQADPDAVESGPWYEIVGVVGDLPVNALSPGPASPRLYHPLAPEQLYPASIAVRVREGRPASFAPRLRRIAASVDPTLRPHRVLPLDQFYRAGELGTMRIGAWAMLLFMLSVLLLSAGGIYALMSFTVTRRRREIGVRAALGAEPRRLLRGIFSRAAAQLGLGVAAGVGLAALLFEPFTGRTILSANGASLLSAVAALMVVVGLLAALGPARRALRIHPVEALRAE